MTHLPDARRCADCGTDLVSEPGIPGLCPQCLLSLALVQSPRSGSLGSSDPDDLLTLDRPAPGRILGERYQIRELLGRGGMGEVFRAFDLKLRVDVALKAVRVERQDSERAQQQLRREVRSAREVLSPNVCRIFDLVTEGGQELVSMEYVDGVTLAETMRERGPLSLSEAREIAAQFLSGLEAIHQAGLVHRDFKPENVMLTRAGRVVVMDFGLAKLASEGRTGTVAGTPAYMAPEQARGDPLDARADVFAAGVVLAEMLSVGGGAEPGRKGDHEARQALWRAVRETPPRVPEGPWAAVLRQSLSPLPEGRPGSARLLSRALEEVTQRLPGFETKRPYPGLMSFTEQDAEYFFGRELEVEALWKKLRRPRMLALAAPSGAGKSSFVRAGLLPALPSGWKALVATPGARPFQGLARTLAPVFAGDGAAVEQLLRFEEEDVAVGLFLRFRRRHEHAALIVDQFEELFTLSPPSVQQAFAKLLGRLVLDADLHVILSLRDDFLYRCHEQDALAPATSDITFLGTLGEAGLRRALVQPALACGYRFADDSLVDEMIGEVKKERGALPLLAFAASRLWEKRDFQRGLITREAYHEIGAVAGALAQHAEATLERIGPPRVPVVRELFRNLVTAQGTRAAREREELLSVFGSDPAVRAEAEAALAGLVDARLLTSYERPGAGGENHHQVEIVHESLLSAWPRLVRWQTQDQDGAQLRDQLRQAAQLWLDRGRPEDLLWSGTAYRDVAVWRERYTGGLTAAEEAFAAAMTAYAGRRRRRRRAGVAALVGLAASVAVVTSVLWQRSEASRRKAEAEIRQREAAQLLALGRLRLPENASAALAHVIASLERADSVPARRMALEALWKGPPVIVEPGSGLTSLWSADGRWLALGSWTGLTLFDRDRGRRHVLGKSGEHPVGFSADGTRLVSQSQAAASELHLWSLPDARLLETWPPTERLTALLIDRRLLTFRFDDTKPPAGLSATVRERSIDGGPEKVLGRWRSQAAFESLLASGQDRSTFAVDPGGERLFSVQAGRLLEQRLDALSAPPRLLGRHDGASWIAEPQGGRLLTAASGELRIWNATTGKLERTLRGPAETRRAFLDPSGRFVAAAAAGPGPPGALVLFDLQAPLAADPIRLLDNATGGNLAMSFHPQGGWLATSQGVWNLAARRATVLRSQKGPAIGVAFTHDGRLVSTSDEGVVRLWALEPGAGEPVRELWAQRPSEVGLFVAPDARDRFVVFCNRWQGQVMVQPLDGSRARQFRLGGRAPTAADPQLDPAGGRAAFVSLEFGNSQASSIRVLDLATGDERVLRTQDTTGACTKTLARLGPVDVPTWLPDGRLVSEGVTGLRVWDLAKGESRQLRPCRPAWDEAWGGPFVRATPDGRQLVTLLVGGAGTIDFSVADLSTGASRNITSHGTQVQALALDPAGTVLVTGATDGLVRVGPFEGGEPHLLYGHTQAVTSVAISPDGKWIASGSEDGAIRLWPMPSGAPLHTLPLEELLAKLRSLTNLRVVADPAAATGYKVEPGPFPGWTKAPVW